MSQFSSAELKSVFVILYVSLWAPSVAHHTTKRYSGTVAVVSVSKISVTCDFLLLDDILASPRGKMSSGVWCGDIGDTVAS